VQAFLLPAGSDLIFEIHYTPSGKRQTDRSSAGFVFADKPAVRIINGAMIHSIAIPAGAQAHREEASLVLSRDVEIRAIQPHMHLRGVGFEVHAIYPTGQDETLLKLRRYDFNWQLTYELQRPARLPRGTVLKMLGIYDNSANNPVNPNPAADVFWGEKTSAEMFMAVLQFAVPIGQSPKDLVPKESLYLEGDTAFEVGSWQSSARKTVQAWKLRLGIP
jgi:hypothetical protein